MSESKATAYAVLLRVPQAGYCIVGDDLGRVLVLRDEIVASLPLHLGVKHVLATVDGKAQLCEPFKFTTEQILSGNIPKAFKLDVGVVDLKHWRWEKYGVDLRLGYSARFRTWLVQEGRVRELEDL